MCKRQSDAGQKAEFSFSSLFVSVTTCLLHRSFPDHMLGASVGQMTCHHAMSVFASSADFGEMRRN